MPIYSSIYLVIIQFMIDGGRVRLTWLTHDGEENAAFIPSCFDGAAQSSGKRIERRVLELFEAFCLEGMSNGGETAAWWETKHTVWPSARIP